MGESLKPSNSKFYTTPEPFTFYLHEKLKKFDVVQLIFNILLKDRN
jgi:hypothetical protein